MPSPSPRPAKPGPASAVTAWVGRESVEAAEVAVKHATVRAATPNQLTAEAHLSPGVGVGGGGYKAPRNPGVLPVLEVDMNLKRKLELR